MFEPYKILLVDDNYFCKDTDKPAASVIIVTQSKPDKTVWFNVSDSQAI